MKTLNDVYPPVKYLFRPLYRFYREKMGLNMYISNMATWGTSALLHAVPFLYINNNGSAAIFGGLFFGLGILSTGEKYLEKRKIRKRNENRKRDLELLTQSSL